MKCIGVRDGNKTYQKQEKNYVFLSRNLDDKTLCVRGTSIQLPTEQELTLAGCSLSDLVLVDEVCSYEQEIFYEVKAFSVRMDCDFEPPCVDSTKWEWLDPQTCLDQFYYPFQNYLCRNYMMLARYEQVEFEKQIHDDLKQLVKPKRYQHSVAVSQMAEKLAYHYQLCPSKARLTGLAHDIAKYFMEEELLQYANDHQLELSQADYLSPKILHGPVGSCYVKEQYGFSDDMCEAIYYHTTGHEKMSLLEKIIFLADKIDDTRTYPGVEEIRALAFVSLNQAIQKFLDDRIVRVIQKHDYLHPLSLETRNDVFLAQEKEHLDL